MKKILYELDFRLIDDSEFEGWYKLYPGFILFVARAGEDYGWRACMQIHKLEISIPGFVDEDWVKEFDKQNKKDEQ